jgi:cell division protein FtsA
VGSEFLLAQKIVYGIDVGTTKIVAVAGRWDDRRRDVEVLSTGEAPSYGLRRGVVVDQEAARNSIATAVEECGVKGGPVSVGIAGGHISSMNTEVTLLNRSRDRRITERFMRRLEQEVRREADPGEEQQILHVVPRDYVLDGEKGVSKPVSMAARRVTMRAHVISGAISSIQNLLQAVEDCGVKVSRVVLEPLASAESCLLDEDRNMGVVLIDVGGGTTDIAVFQSGALIHTAVIPFGGQSLSSDLAYGLEIPFEAAEKLKLHHGTVLSKTVDPTAPVKLADRHYNLHFMSEILEYRAREIFELAQESIEKIYPNRISLPGGVVLTGGGAHLEGMTELCENILDMRSKTAFPRRLRGNLKPLQQPKYSTSVGLLYFAAKNNQLIPENKSTNALNFDSIVEAVKSWFRVG